MQYVGIHTQQRTNNIRSVLLLCTFPLIIIALVWVFLYCLAASGDEPVTSPNAYVAMATEQTIIFLPCIAILITAWFLIAYLSNTAMVRLATGAEPVERRDNPRVYNIVENLTMSCGMQMPKINVIDSPELNAFASGIDNASYTVTVTTGLCDVLDDDELSGVIAHELTHIRNHDTRVLIISIIFVGILSTIMNLSFRLLRSMSFSGDRRSNSNNKNGTLLVLIAGILAAIGYFLTLLTRFAISRKREFMADAGGAEMCGNPLALASALRKISTNPLPAPKGRDDIAQLYIVHTSLAEGLDKIMSDLFATHPDTEERIRILEQF